MTSETIIDGDDFAAALQADAQTRKLIEDGIAYAEKLQREGRDHSIPGGLLHTRCPNCGHEI